jgi:hypothetical protein
MEGMNEIDGPARYTSTRRIEMRTDGNDAFEFFGLRSSRRFLDISYILIGSKDLTQST